MKEAFICDLIFHLCWRVKPGLARFYQRVWNPVNYMLIGGIGVLINMIVWLFLINRFDWVLVNMIAILCAWSWNWANSVGFLCGYWGFKESKQYES